MKKFLKPGRVVILLTGRYAGKKAVILKANFEGYASKKFGCCLVAGISRYPRKVHRRMTEEKIARRIRIKPFVKWVNFSHFMPTRYVLSEQIDVKSLIKNFDSQSTLKKEGEGAEKNKDPLDNAEFKDSFRKKIRTMLEEKFNKFDLNKQDDESHDLQFLFKPLRF